MASRERPAEIHVDGIDLKDYPAGAPFRLWLGLGASIFVMTDPENGRAVMRRPSDNGFGASILGSRTEALVTVGTRPIDEEFTGRSQIGGPELDDDTVEWGNIIFDSELVLRLEEGSARGRIWRTGQPVLGLEPGRAV